MQCPAGVGVRQVAISGGQRKGGLDIDIDTGNVDGVQGGGQRGVVRIGGQPRVDGAAGFAPALLRLPSVQLRGVEGDRVGQHSWFWYRRCAVYV